MWDPLVSKHYSAACVFVCQSKSRLTFAGAPQRGLNLYVPAESETQKRQSVRERKSRGGERGWEGRRNEWRIVGGEREI